MSVVSVLYKPYRFLFSPPPLSFVLEDFELRMFKKKILTGN